MKTGGTVLTISNLSKTYPNGLTAVKELSLNVEPGTIFGLIGPNGAGKSTLMKLACGLLSSDRGSVRCGDVEVSNQPRLAAEYIGLMPDPLGVYTDVSVSEYLEFFARVLYLQGQESRRRRDQVIELMGLGPWLSSEVETLSSGWQRRLALARVLLSEAPILLLDEPAAGLDVSARQGLLEIVRGLADTGKTVVVSSHILPELEELADIFGVMSSGAWVETIADKPFFTRGELQLGFGIPRWLIRSSDPKKVVSIAKSFVIEEREDGLLVTVEDEASAAILLSQIVEQGIRVFEFRKITTNLNSLVLENLIRGEKSDD